MSPTSRTITTTIEVLKWIVLSTLVGLTAYLIWWYVMMPRRLDMLAQQYNDLVTKFNTAVKLTTVAYLHVGPKSQNMPLTMTFRSVNGLQDSVIAANVQGAVPYLYDPDKNIEKQITIIGYEAPSNGEIYMRQLKILEDVQSSDQGGTTTEVTTTVNYDAAIETFLKETGQLKATDNIGDPAVVVPECRVDTQECGLRPGGTYKIVANQAGAFHLRPVTPEDHQSDKLPTTRPKFVKYKLAANTTISSSPF